MESSLSPSPKSSFRNPNRPTICVTPTDEFVKFRVEKSIEEIDDMGQIFDGVSPIKELDPTSNQKIFEYS